VLPRNEALEPIMAPHASDRNRILAYSLVWRRSPMAPASSRVMGKSIAAVACAGIHTVRNAAVSITPEARVCGPR
jgi:hypothetical protein